MLVHVGLGDCGTVGVGGVGMLTQVCLWYVHCAKASKPGGAMGTDKCTHGWADWG